MWTAIASRFVAVSAGALVAIGTTAAAAHAQTGGNGFMFRPPVGAITIYGGYAAPRAASDLFRFSMDELTLGRSDFQAGTVGGDISIVMGDRYDLVLGISSSTSQSRSEFRDWVDNNDLPIEQTTTYRRVPMSASVRYYLKPRGERIGSIAWIPVRFEPFVSLGGGAMKYRFEQVGDFIDYNTLDIFFDRYVSTGHAAMAQGSVGAGWGLTKHLRLTGELRYQHARGRLSNDFQGFKPLDLSGVSSSVGFTLRF